MTTGFNLTPSKTAEGDLERMKSKSDLVQNQLNALYNKLCIANGNEDSEA